MFSLCVLVVLCGKINAELMRSRVNGQIKATHVTVIDEHGAELGVFSLSDALALARSQEKDLVEVDANCTPPVCQVIDYGKYRYRDQNRGKARGHE